MTIRKSFLALTAVGAVAFSALATAAPANAATGTKCTTWTAVANKVQARTCITSDPYADYGWTEVHNSDSISRHVTIRTDLFSPQWHCISSSRTESVMLGAGISSGRMAVTPYFQDTYIGPESAGGYVTSRNGQTVRSITENWY
ncbi:hypothetical protein ACIOMM_36370 [Streptomyces sp. NPDC087908]|uniref:hypothetical protein n=1 Tax=Streptomyces sp. NPDC087908 TaxID=3365820 RepID=UPI0038012537